MAWPNPFTRDTPNTKRAWGFKFEFSPEHLTPTTCEPLKHSYDERGEAVLNRLNEISPPLQKDLPRNSSRHPASEKNPEIPDSTIRDDEKEATKSPRRDLYAILRDNAPTDPLLADFWREVNTVPDWVDWAQIERGQDVFYRYGGACLTGLAYQSLLGGMGAARVVETLARTGGFSTKVARGRLFETTQHILQCTKSLESIQPGGDGFASTLRVRLLHVAVRQRILALEKARPGYYNVAEWGIPINDLDSMATIATFSSTLIWLSLPRQGLVMREQEKVDYIALWRYIGHVIGCPTKGFFETPAQAKRVMEALLLYEIHPTPTSKVLANNIIKSLEGQPPGYASADFLTASARWLNGNELCDELGLPRVSPYYTCLMAGQCMFFCFFTYTYRSVPSWDRSKIKLLKKVFFDIIVNTKYGLRGKESVFEFKYVPEYETVTLMGECEEEKQDYSAVERRNLRTFLVGCAGIGVGCFVAVKVLGLVWRAVW